jgi:hypothetical protein
LSSQHAITKAAYASTNQVRVATLYRTAYPEVFGSAEDSITVSFGSAMSSYTKRHNQDTPGGIVNVIQAGVDNYQERTAVLITQQIGDAELHDLASLMLARSKEFITEMCHFIEEFYSEMTQSSAMCELEAWTLTASLLFEIIRERNMARSIVKQARDSKPLLHVWGVIKTHEVMERFMANHFRDNPALTGILVQHIIRRQKNVDSTGQLTKKIAFMEGQAGYSPDQYPKEGQQGGRDPRFGEEKEYLRNCVKSRRKTGWWRAQRRNWKPTEGWTRERWAAGSGSWWKVRRSLAVITGKVLGE